MPSSNWTAEPSRQEVREPWLTHSTLFSVRLVPASATFNPKGPSHHLVEPISKREQILLTAYEILGKSGLENLHARTIAGELGLNHAAIHYYFKTREDLIVALIGYAQKRFDTDLERVLSNVHGAGKRLEAQIALYEAYAKPQSRYFRALASLFVAGANSERVREAEKALVQHLFTRLERATQEAEAEGTLRRESPFAQPQMLHEYLMGLCFRAQLGGLQDPTPQIDRLFQGLFRA